MTVAIATDPIGYSVLRVDEASSVPVTREYVAQRTPGLMFDVPVEKAPPGSPMWKSASFSVRGRPGAGRRGPELSESAIPARRGRPWTAPTELHGCGTLRRSPLIRCLPRRAEAEANSGPAPTRPEDLSRPEFGRRRSCPMTSATSTAL